MAFVAPAPFHDLAVDGIAGLGPMNEVGREPSPACDRDRPVQSHPGHEPAIREVLTATTGFPDAVVGLVPVLAEPVDDVAETFPTLIRHRQAVQVAEVHRVQSLTEDVELQLGCGAVPDPDGARTAPSVEVVELHFLDVPRPVDAVHDLQRRAGGSMTVSPVSEPGGEPAKEVLRLLGVSETEQGVDGERRVAYPRVAVVPVALTAGLLRQAGGRRRDECPRGFVGHQLQRDRGPLHVLAPATHVVRPAHPAAPEVARRLEHRQHLVRCDLAWGAVGRGLEDDATDLALLERDGGADAVAVLARVRAMVSVDARTPDDVQRELSSVVTVEGDTIVEDVHRMALPRIVEARLAVEHESK